MQNAGNDDIDIAADTTPGIVDHDHRSVIQISDALPRLLAFLQHEDPDRFTGKNDRTQGIAQFIDIQDPDTLQFSHLIEVEIVGDDAPADFFGQHDQLGIDSCMLEHPEDLKAMVEAMQFIDELVHQPQVRDYYGALIQPGSGDDWGEFARKTYDSYHHGVGTCKMGPASDPTAVVDQRLRVHGLQNLWVGDASIMPVVSRANTNLTSIMIGERLADFVQEVA